MITGPGLIAASGRIDDIRRTLSANKLDAIIVSHPPFLRYLFNYSGSWGIGIIGKKNLWFITNDLYTEQIRHELFDLDNLKTFIDRNAYQVIAKNIADAKWKSVGFDPSRTTVAEGVLLRKAVKPAVAVPIGGIVEKVIMVKTRDEIRRIRAAASIGDAAYAALLENAKSGMTEKDVAAFLSMVTRALGSEADAFDIIAVGGPRSAMPHGRAGNNRLKKGDVVTVDFGCRYKGMNSDMTRVFSIGKPSEAISDVFGILTHAHHTALSAARSGIRASDLDNAARSVISKAGFGDNFRHSLGHGLGYEVHEAPRVSAANKSEKLVKGTVITIEPGIYLPDRFGMRIEDDVVIGDKGPVFLTNAPRDLIQV